MYGELGAKQTGGVTPRPFAAWQRRVSSAPMGPFLGAVSVCRAPSGAVERWRTRQISPYPVRAVG
jgi:hypothetical protein